MLELFLKGAYISNYNNGIHKLWFLQLNFPPAKSTITCYMIVTIVMMSISTYVLWRNRLWHGRKITVDLILKYLSTYHDYTDHNFSTLFEAVWLTAVLFYGKYNSVVVISLSYALQFTSGVKFLLDSVDPAGNWTQDFLNTSQNTSQTLLPLSHLDLWQRSGSQAT